MSNKKVIKANQFFKDRLFDAIQKKAKPIIVADRIKTPENMGMILRIAGNIGCGKVLFIDSGQPVRTKKIKKTAQTSFNKIDWEICQLDELNDLLPKNYHRIAIETTANATNLFEMQFPVGCAFFVGNEAHGLSEELLSCCESSVYIPMTGSTVSMNVSHALAVVLFEWVRQVGWNKSI